MKLSKVIHPEIMLNRRGTSILRLPYREFLPSIKHCPEGYLVTNHDLASKDRNIISHFCLCYRFKHNSGKIYHVGKEFLEAISKVDREIPIQYLPDNMMVYFSFAEKTIYDGEEEIQGAYVYIGDAKNTILNVSEWGQKVIWVSYVSVNMSYGRWISEVTAAKVSEILQNQSTMDFNYNPNLEHINKGSREEVYRTIINLALYTNSSGADFLSLKPMHNESNNKKNIEEKNTGYVNECTLPLTLLGWNYHNERKYTVDATWVETHPRWQPCGPNHSEVKLIWVKGHERHYNGPVK